MANGDKEMIAVERRANGTRQMDASAILDYFAPLQAWLTEKNQGQSCGW